MSDIKPTSITPVHNANEANLLNHEPEIEVSKGDEEGTFIGDEVKPWSAAIMNATLKRKGMHPHEPRDDLSTRPWTCIATNNPYHLKLSHDAIKQLANKASTIIIRSVSQKAICVVSRPDDEPITRLRAGKDLSSSNMCGDMLGGDIDQAKAAHLWEGPPELVNRLRVSWTADRGNTLGLNGLYWACCNDGMHFMPNTSSGWYFKRPANLEILIDAPPPDGHEELKRTALDTKGLWDVLTWDAAQTAAFVLSMDAFGSKDSKWAHLARILEDAKTTASTLLLGCSAYKSFIFHLQSDRIRKGLPVPPLALDGAGMLNALMTLLIAEAYRLQGPQLIDKLKKDFVEVDEKGLERPKRGMAPDWQGKDLGQIYLNDCAMPLGDLASLPLDDSVCPEWMVTLTITTSKPDGTIFARSSADGMWHKGEGEARPKMLFVRDGFLGFDIGWVGCLIGRARIDNGVPHEVGLQLKGGYYSIHVDGQLESSFTEGKERMAVVKDPSDSIFFKGQGIAVASPKWWDLAQGVDRLRQKGGGLYNCREPWFWCPCSPYVVGIQMVVQDVLEVDAVNETALIRYTLCLYWYDQELCDWSKTDSQFLHQLPHGFDKACKDAGEPKPQYINATEDPMVTSISRQRNVSLSCIVTTIEAIGTFYDPVDVKVFPFDVQDFKIVVAIFKGSLGVDKQLVPVDCQGVDAKGRTKSVASYNAKNSNPERIIDQSNPEWIIDQPSFRFDSHANTFELTLQMQRKPNYYLANIVLPLTLLGSLSFTVFATQVDEFGDRFGILGTLLLTAMAAKFTYGDSTPKVAYQTWLDKYVLFVFAFLAVFTMAAAVAGFLDSQHLDMLFITILFLVWLLAHASVLMTILYGPNAK